MNLEKNPNDEGTGGVVLASGTETIDRVILELNGICKSATFEFALKVGKLIIDNFYSGDLDAWRHRGAKNTSFRKLAKHPSLPMSPSALYRSVAIYEVCVRLGINACKHISTSHIRLVLSLPKAEQMRLLRAAEVEAWPVRRLRDEVMGLPSSPSSDVVEPSVPTDIDRLQSSIRAIGDCLEKTETLVDAVGDELDLSSETARSLEAVVQRMRDTCRLLERRLHKCEPESPDKGSGHWRKSRQAS